MEVLCIISEDYCNFWCIVVMIDIVVDEMEFGSKVDLVFFIFIFDYIEYFMDVCYYVKEDDYLFFMLCVCSYEVVVVFDCLQVEYCNGLEIFKLLCVKLVEMVFGKFGNVDFVVVLCIYMQSLKSYICIEEKDVMLLVCEVLSVEDWVSIDCVFFDSEDLLFGEKVKVEFCEFFYCIVSLVLELIGFGVQSVGELQLGVGVWVGEVLLLVFGLESCYGWIKVLKGIDFEV